MTTLAALLHTYYLPRIGRCLGVLAGHAELCDRLRREWEARCQPDDEPHISDGFSVWLDRQGKVHACVVRRMAAQMLDDPALLQELSKLLTSTTEDLAELLTSATSEAVEEAPERPPA